VDNLGQAIHSVVRIDRLDAILKKNPPDFSPFGFRMAESVSLASRRLGSRFLLRRLPASS
jgi:hypothetical protein